MFQPDIDLLRVQVSSIRNQTVTDWTCHIGIDGPDPATAEHLQGLLDQDPRFVVHEFDINVGFYRNFERLLHEVEPGVSWVALSDQDDHWYPQKLAVLLSAMGEGTTLVCGQARIASRTGADLGLSVRREVSLSSLLLNNHVTGSLAVFRRDLLDTALPFPAATSTAFHDHWLGACALAVGELRQVDTVVQDYVQHGQNVIGETTRTSIRAQVQRLVSAAGGIGDVVRVLRDERWGWRVQMGRELLVRCPGARTEFVGDLAQRGATGAVALEITRAVRRREMPWQRGFSLWAGAVAWRLRRPRSHRRAAVSGSGQIEMGRDDE